MKSKRRLTLAGVAASLLAAVLLCLVVVNGNSAPARLWAAPEGPIVYQDRSVEANGKVVIMVGTSRTYGYRIGDIFPVRILVITAPSVKVSLDGLRNKIITLGTSPFEMASDAQISHYESEGKSVWQVDLALRQRTFPADETLDFSADFLYSVDTTDSGSPYWREASTGTITFTMIKTASEKAERLEQGNLAHRPDDTPKTGWPLIALGLALLLVLPLYAARRLRRWHRREPFVSDEEHFWQIFDAVTREAGQSGWRLSHSRATASALRHYLKVDQKTVRELAQVDYYHSQRARILSVLETCDAHLYGGKAPSEAAVRKMEADVKLIVPRTPPV